MSNGTLRARLKLQSVKLTDVLPIEVRDSALALVGEIRHAQELQLPPGLYQVSAVLDDGHAHRQLVQVEKAKVSEVTISTADVVAGRWHPEPAGAVGADIPEDAVRGGNGPPGPPLSPIVPVPPRSSASYTFVRAADAEMQTQTSEEWLFLPTSGGPSSMPHAVLSLDNAVRSISLPVNPRGAKQGLRACLLRFERYRDGVEPRAWFHPERRVSSSLQQMLAQGQIFIANSVAEQTAEDLLYAKYQDPTGAALGALVMYRAGTLERRREWLENLARSFEWLADGKILLAAQLLDSSGDASRAAELLLEAAKQRPLFTLSYSVLLDALRRWPLPDRRDEVAQALAVLTKTSSKVDWGALTLTIREDTSCA